MKDLFGPKTPLSVFHPLNLIQLFFIVASVNVLNWEPHTIDLNRVLIVFSLSILWSLVSFSVQKWIVKKELFSNRFYIVNTFLFPVILISVTIIMMTLFG